MRTWGLTGIVLCAACSGVPFDLGLHAGLRVAGAQFVEGRMPEDSGGPGVDGASLGVAALPAGISEQIMVGTLAPTATAAMIGFDDDIGYWLLAADPPESLAPTRPTFHARVALAKDLPPGPQRVRVRATNAQGESGPPLLLSLHVTNDQIPAGRLVVRLSFEGPADLDLHLLDPTGAEVWSQHPTAYLAPKPPALPDPVAQMRAGRLDADANAGCVLDGRGAENVIYTNPPPAGHYVVRVDATSLCGAPYAYFRVSVVRPEQPSLTAAGVLLDADTRGNHEAGAGRTVLAFDVP